MRRWRGWQSLVFAWVYSSGLICSAGDYYASGTLGLAGGQSLQGKSLPTGPFPTGQYRQASFASMTADEPVAEPQPVPAGSAIVGSDSCDGGHFGATGGICQGRCSDGGEEVCLSWFGQCVANTEVFILGDAFKTVGDATGSIGSIDNSFGMRLVANTGIPLKDLPFQGQFGVSFGG